MNQAKNLSEGTEISVGYFLGESEMSTQVNDHLIVITTGALLICLEQGYIIVNESNKTNCIIFDEIDILSSSDENQRKLVKISKYLKKNQKIFFSTTCSDKAFDFVRKRISYDLEKFNSIYKDDFFKNLIQFCVRTKQHKEKYKALRRILENTNTDRIIIFINSRFEADLISSYLAKDGYSVICLCSKSSTEHRLNAYERFKNKEAKVLILNYPLLHGIDLGDEIQLIINYDLPYTIKDLNYEYFHRISKCGRLEKPGFVINFFAENNMVSKFENYYDLKLIKLDPFT